jgi:hypothetical protein
VETGGSSTGRVNSTCPSATGPGSAITAGVDDRSHDHAHGHSHSHLHATRPRRPRPPTARGADRPRHRRHGRGGHRRRPVVLWPRGEAPDTGASIAGLQYPRATVVDIGHGECPTFEFDAPPTATSSAPSSPRDPTRDRSSPSRWPPSTSTFPRCRSATASSSSTTRSPHPSSPTPTGSTSATPRWSPSR